MFDNYFKNISNESFDKFSNTSQKAVMKIIKNPQLLCDMVKHIPLDPVLVDKTECYDFLDKLVVYTNDRLGIYARISLFRDGYGERIHYHRWNYTSYILSGGYSQNIFGSIVDKKDISKVDYKDIVLQEKLKAGNICSLESSLIHSIKAEPQTLTFCIRGMALRDRFQVKDVMNETVWWQYGSAYETIEEKAAKRMPQLVLNDKIEQIVKIIQKCR